MSPLLKKCFLKTFYRVFNANPPSILQQDDEFVWGATPDGNFTTKSAYATLQGVSANSNLSIFNTIWKWRGTERVCILLSKLGHGIVLTNVERNRRLMSPTGLCHVCNSSVETLFHCFRDYKKNLSIWYSLKVRNQQRFFSEQNWENWLEMNLSRKGTGDREANWNIMFGFALDTIWRNRNYWIFSHKHSTVQASI